jgi:hypothetical protein
MIAETAGILKVMGNKREMAATGPNPGNTPTRVPKNTPIKQNIRLEGVTATLNPKMILSKMVESTVFPLSYLPNTPCNIPNGSGLCNKIPNII